MKAIIFSFICLMLVSSVFAVELTNAPITQTISESSTPLSWWERYFVYNIFESGTTVVSGGVMPSNWQCASQPTEVFAKLGTPMVSSWVIEVGVSCPSNSIVSLYKCANTDCTSRTKSATGYKINGVHPKFTSWTEGAYYGYLCYDCSGTSGTTPTCTYPQYTYYCSNNQVYEKHCASTRVVKSCTCDSNADTLASGGDYPATDSTITEQFCTKNCDDSSKFFCSSGRLYDQCLTMRSDCPSPTFTGCDIVSGKAQCIKSSTPSPTITCYKCSAGTLITETTTSTTCSADFSATKPTCVAPQPNATDTCLKAEDTFYTGGTINMYSNSALWTLPNAYSGDIRSEDITSMKTYLPDFANKYYSNKDSVCCSDLSPSYIGTKTSNYKEGLPLYNQIKFDLTYKEYKCSAAGGSFDICSNEFITNLPTFIGMEANCTTGWVIAGVAVLLLILLLGRR